MIVAHRVQKRRVPAMPWSSPPRRRKSSCPAGRIFASIRQVLPLNDCLAWLVPRGKTRARRG
jgi:hypothetical protein